MKTTIGGDRLGSGNKQNISLRQYERSTHDLSYIWRSSMSSGTLVPFMNLVALPGDSFDIDLNTQVLTLPTVGPLYGSFKVQLDVFQIPIRLYNAALHMNKLGIGMDMSQVLLPQIEVEAQHNRGGQPDSLEDNAQINPSCLLKYLGISGIGKIDSLAGNARRAFNGVPFLGYWDIYKNYYANKQEEKGAYILTSAGTIAQVQAVIAATLIVNGITVGNLLDTETTVPAGNGFFELIYQFGAQASQPKISEVRVRIEGVNTVTQTVLSSYSWNDEKKQLIFGADYTAAADEQWNVLAQTPPPNVTQMMSPVVREFDLANIDNMREKILQAPTNAVFDVTDITGDEPYFVPVNSFTIDGLQYNSVEFTQSMLALKTYQSDLFNNWISTEWIDGANGINEVTAVDTTGDSFSIDALNLANKVYNMLNRIAISGGSYDDWLDAVYTHQRTRSVESPIYLGSLIKELGFQEVVSNSEAVAEDNVQPLGTLGGRGQLTGKNKGGHIKVRVDEPSYLMGIVSLTPRIDYSQGNMWDVNLKTMNDLHKPALDAIGYQDLITEQMAWQSTEYNWVAGTSTGTPTFRSAGKQPAWINYMTAVNKTYGNFADRNADMFMTLNRRYDINPATGEILDLTTYIDPVKFNHIFAQTSLDAQNFWVQIAAKVISRRKMSAKVIPNL